MSDRFDVLERFVPMFEAPEPSFEAFLRRRDRKRRNQRIAAGAVGIAVFLAAVWIVTSGGSLDRTQTPGATGPTAPEVGRYPTGLIGLPPDGAEPSFPMTGEVVASFGFGHTDGDPGRFHMTVYADGRVIWERFGDPTGEGPATGLIEQRLSREGIELVRSEILAAAPFERDLHYTAAHGLHFGQIEVLAKDGDRLVSLSWGDIFSDGPPDGVPIVTPTAAQATALQQLDARLGDLSSWLPATAWKTEEPRPFVPSRYSICYETLPGQGLDRVLDSLPQAAAERLRPLDKTHERSDRFGLVGTGFEIWCSTMATEQARELAEVFDGTRYTLLDHGLELAYGSPPGKTFDVSIAFVPLLPHES